jgi:hypothetical protein
MEDCWAVAMAAKAKTANEYFILILGVVGVLVVGIAVNE